MGCESTVVMFDGKDKLSTIEPIASVPPDKRTIDPSMLSVKSYVFFGLILTSSTLSRPLPIESLKRGPQCKLRNQRIGSLAGD